MLKPNVSLVLSVTLATSACFLSGCENTTQNTSNTTSPTNTGTGKGLKIGSLLPTTGDLASIGQQMAGSVPLLVETVSAAVS